ncbi:hypothetical protein TIFTF001_039730 [Ficus carica]|uniref:Uncharacterized protein n=1 Tax=Ficus carica TaxID=3494 RepID=A0AA87YZF7_FICCA|nr:hypothetical protein TIFTF001_039730 [Ficus carica]
MWVLREFRKLDLGVIDGKGIEPVASNGHPHPPTHTDISNNRSMGYGCSIFSEKNEKVLLCRSLHHRQKFCSNSGDAGVREMNTSDDMFLTQMK